MEKTPDPFSLDPSQSETGMRSPSRSQVANTAHEKEVVTAEASSVQISW